MQTRKEQLQSVINTAREELRQIEAAERRESASGLVGKYFKYQNRYSSDSSWWLYIYVTAVTESGGVETVEFQTDCYGKSEFESRTNFTMPDSAYIPITKKQYVAALEKTLAKINKTFGA